MAVWNAINLSYMARFNRSDAEFFKPEYENAFKKVLGCNGEKLRFRAFVTDGIHASPDIANSGSGVRYISAKCVKDNEFVVDNCIFISENQHIKNPRTQLQQHDVIITTVGTIGNVAVVDDGLIPSNSDRHVGIVRVHNHFELSPFYLATFLNSCYGRFQSLREAAGNVQLNLYIRNIGNIVVPRFGKHEEDEISDLTKKAYDFRKSAKASYTQAQQLLESELGLDKLHFDKPVGYTARFSVTGLTDIFDAGRIDAQCFSPEAVFYEDWLLKHAKCDRLNALLSITAKGLQQTEVEGGTTDYCSIKHISGREIVGASKTKPTGGTPRATKNDLLLAITGATIGKIGIVNRYENLVFSGDMLRMRVNNEVPPHYLLLALDHHLGQVQFNRWITGSTNGHLAPRDVGRVLVPRLSPEKEDRISALVAESLEKRQKSEALLDQAKSRVEQLIEEAVQT